MAAAWWPYSAADWVEVSALILSGVQRSHLSRIQASQGGGAQARTLVVSWLMSVVSVLRRVLLQIAATWPTSVLYGVGAFPAAIWACEL